MPECENKVIEYRSLSSSDRQNLRDSCLGKIRADSKQPIYVTVKHLCSLKWCYGTSIDPREMTNEAIEVVKYLHSIAPTTKNLFLLNSDTELALKYSQLMEMDMSIEFKDSNPHAIAWGLKLYIEDLNTLIPRDVTKILIMAYTDQKTFTKKVVLERIPFIITERERTFFKKFKNLLLEMERHKEEGNMSMNDVIDIFAPLILKRPKDMESVRLFLLRTILQDILNTEFDKFTIGFFDY